MDAQRAATETTTTTVEGGGGNVALSWPTGRKTDFLTFSYT